jgi:hypothetical protein
MKVLNVQNLIETQANLRQERNLSQFVRFLDTNPVPSTYYSINNPESTTEIGTGDVMSYVAEDSPVRYNKILNLPLFSVNAITATITYDETTGTYTEYADQAQVLNQTIQPNPGDAFIIGSFNPEIIFMITAVGIRAIKGKDHYIIEYSVVPTSRIKRIENQVTDTYETIYRNIGTEDKAIIRREDYNLLEQCVDSYGKLLDRYLEENYDDDIGYLRTPDNLSDDILGMGTCKYLIKFLTDNRVIYFDEILEMIFAFETPLAFEPKHNRNYNRTFFLQKFITKTMEKDMMSYVSFRSLPVSLFKEIEDVTLYQSIEFDYLPIQWVEPTPDPELETPPEEGELELVLPEAPYGSMLLLDYLYTNSIIDKNYEGLSGLKLVVAKAYNDEKITVDEFNTAINDYDATDFERFYLIPYVLFILKVKIKALQK